VIATGADITAVVRAGRVSAVDVTRQTLARIARHDPALNAFTAITGERAVSAAAAIDAKIAAGVDPGPLAGVPFAVKNLFDVRGIRTLAGAKINSELPPAAHDARLVERMEAAGAILVGALNMGEYAYDFTGRNAHYGPSRNPHDTARMSGGSSGGSGSAVGGGLVPIALGSDTNGSIRVPSSLCGAFGLKPTYGRLSRHATFPFVTSLDHLGPLARSVRDLALSYDAMQGPDPADPACANRDIEAATPTLERGIAGLRIAVADGYFAEGGNPEAHDAVARVAASLGITATVTVPEAARARAAAFVITSAEGAAFHMKRLQTRAADFDPETRDRFLAGTMVPAAWYNRAQRFRSWYRQRVLDLFAGLDAFLAPATPCTAPLVEQMTMEIGGRTLPVRANMGIFTQPISFIGLPVVAVPLRTSSGLPIAVQVVAAPWREDVALRIAAELERTCLCSAPVPEAFLT
jgi:aspartyl-tRNA(Asn)/glutamyl-tRNA(Gln) amidotransferase subunit A